MTKRRRGSRSARLQPRRAVRHRPFEALVDEALAAIPMPFAAALDEVAIVIADEPSDEQLADEPADGQDGDGGLYGLYEGVPRTEWGADWIPVPNRITLFRLALEADFPDPDDLADEVWVTVVHELAHHLGIDDERLHALGVD
jgi:predicted Zn-dependent protease with MMP-like domain